MNFGEDLKKTTFAVGDGMMPIGALYLSCMIFDVGLIVLC